MLRRFSLSAGANLTAVALGLYKQYLIASMLSVVSFGAYGTATTWAGLLTVLIPFPGYLRLLTQGMSSAASDQALRDRLKQDCWLEFVGASVLAGIVLAVLAVAHRAGAITSEVAVPLVLLALAQYATISSDIVLRMEDRHRRLALLQTLRNLPVTLLLVFVPVSTPSAVALAELVSILCTAALVRGTGGRLPAWSLRQFAGRRWHLDGGTASLWSARIFQNLARSTPRLVVPLLYSGTDVGLFFFALIAQAPCSILLSVCSQVFGRTLATASAGDLRKLLLIQLGYALPNLLYAAAVFAAVPFWDDLMRLSPTLTKYTGASALVTAVVVVGCVQASDCLEFMLFKGRRSRVLLAYNVAACILQLAGLALCHLLGLGLAPTLYVVGAMALASTSAATGYVFWSVSSGRWQ